MTKLRRFQCPTCGALLRDDPTLGAVRCDFCNRRSALAEPASASPRMRLAPALDRSEAVLALRRGLVETGTLPASLRSDVRPADVRLVYAPFHVARGIRVGVVEREPEDSVDVVTDVSSDGRTVTRRVVRRKSDAPAQAKVVVTDAEQIRPAVRRRDWGLESADIGGMITRGASVVPWDPDDAKASASVLPADDGPGDSVRGLEGAGGGATGRTRLVASSTRSLMVPVWKIRYRVQNGLYDAVVDAVEGRLLAARAPENDRHRIPTALAYLAAASLMLGFVLRGAVWMFMGTGDLHIWLLLAFVALAALALFGTYAWNVVRYDAERVWLGGRLTAEYLNKPPSTALERFWEGMFGRISEATDISRERGDD